MPFSLFFLTCFSHTSLVQMESQAAQQEIKNLRTRLGVAEAARKRAMLVLGTGPW